MNGILTIKDEATQQVINQHVFIPYIFLNANNINSLASSQILLNNGSLVINNVSPTPQIPDNSKSALSPCVEHIVIDHSYCIPSNSSCPTNNPSVDSPKKPDGIDVLKSIDLTTKFALPPLPVITSVTSLAGASNDVSGKEIIKEDPEIVQQDSKDSEIPQPQKPKKKYKSHKEKKRCYKCNKDICSSYMYFHLGKHRHDDRKKLKRKQERERQKLEKELNCTMCDSRFDTKEELAYHLELHQSFICEKCGKSFAKKTSLSVHMTTHNPANFICEVCGKGWKNAGALRDHFQIHENNTFKCEICLKMFGRKSKLRYHVKTIHQKRDSVQCSYCGKTFSNEANHKLHVRLIHFGEKPYECKICLKKFGRKDYLKNHKNCRRSDDPNPPPSKSVRKNILGLSGLHLQKDLNRPIKKNGEPVPCKLCGKPFTIAAAMKRHLVSHVRRYSCKYCPLTFCAKALSQRHEKIHLEGEFFRCDVCWKRFESKAMLEEHSTKHTNASYVCNMCGKAFNRRYLMNHHKLLDHADTSDQSEVKKVVIESLLEVDEQGTES